MHFKWFFIGFIAALVLFLNGISFITPAGSQENEAFEIALIGDAPYDATEEAQFINVMEEINRSRVAFVVHDGDFKSGASPCTDELFESRKQLFDQFDHPFIFILGDNEWTDCHRGNLDPLERLNKVRELFTAGNQSLGRRTLTLTRQSENPQYNQFRENVRWVYGNVLFAGFNLPGSNNNLGRTPAMDAEYQERNAANLAWLRESFELAKRNNNLGIMLIIQADPFFEKPAEERTGLNDFITALTDETRSFAKPVVLVHGDTHYFRIDKPLPIPVEGQPTVRLMNFTRVMTFGSPDVHWLRATINPNREELFDFQQEIVAANRMDG